MRLQTMTVGELQDKLSVANLDDLVVVQVPNEAGNVRAVTDVEAPETWDDVAVVAIIQVAPHPEPLP